MLLEYDSSIKELLRWCSDNGIEIDARIELIREGDASITVRAGDASIERTKRACQLSWLFDKNSYES